MMNDALLLYNSYTRFSGGTYTGPHRCGPPCRFSPRLVKQRLSQLLSSLLACFRVSSKPHPRPHPFLRQLPPGPAQRQRRRNICAPARPGGHGGRTRQRAGTAQCCCCCSCSAATDGLVAAQADAAAVQHRLQPGLPADGQCDAGPREGAGGSSPAANRRRRRFQMQRPPSVRSRH